MSMLQIAQSGARAYSKALDVVADNVANVGTPGYVRRSSSLVAANVSASAGPMLRDPVGGNGVRMESVGRAVDALQMDTLRRAEGDVSALDAAGRWLRATQSVLTGPSSIEEPYIAFMDSLADLATDPTDLSLRQSFLMRADFLADRFNSNAADLEQLQADIRIEANNEARLLTNLGKNLSDLNGQIRRATSGSAAKATLMDQRDRILAEMSTVTALEVEYDQFGQAKVRIPDAGGPVLVEGNRSKHVRIESTGSGFELRVGPQGQEEYAPVVGGSLSGLSDAAQRISQSQARLDDLATRLAADMNAAHANGVDLDGNDGLNLFSVVQPRVTLDAANAGNARVTATIDPDTPLQDSRLIFDGTEWTLENSSNSVTGPLPLTLDGLTVDAAEPGITGDVYRITAQRPAVALSFNQLDPQQLAMSARWITDHDAANTGHGQLELQLDAGAAVPGTPPFTLTVLGDGSVELFDSMDPDTPIAAGPAGDWLQGDGFAVRLSGNPAAGDSFYIDRAATGEANNLNAQALLALRDAVGTSGGYGDALDSLRSIITTSLAETNNRLDLATARRDGAAQALQESSGVDLNTEAAEMLRLQQAFQANARVIQASKEIFDTILSATR